MCVKDFGSESRILRIAFPTVICYDTLAVNARRVEASEAEGSDDHRQTRKGVPPNSDGRAVNTPTASGEAFLWRWMLR